jgi:hypothetical protein
VSQEGFVLSQASFVVSQASSAADELTRDLFRQTSQRFPRLTRCLRVRAAPTFVPDTERDLPLCFPILADAFTLLRFWCTSDAAAAPPSSLAVYQPLGNKMGISNS